MFEELILILGTHLYTSVIKVERLLCEIILLSNTNCCIFSSAIIIEITIAEKITYLCKF